MKKIYQFFISILSLVIFNSCSSNDDIPQNEYNSKLQNTKWELTKIEFDIKHNNNLKNTEVTCPEEIIFKNDSIAFVFPSANEWNSNSGCVFQEGFSSTYKIEKNKLILVDSDYEITSLTKNQLILKTSQSIFISTGFVDSEVLKTYKLITREVN